MNKDKQVTGSYPKLPILGWAAFTGERVTPLPGVLNAPYRRDTTSGRAAPVGSDVEEPLLGHRLLLLFGADQRFGLGRLAVDEEPVLPVGRNGHRADDSAPFSHPRAGNGSRPAPCSRSILIWQHAVRIVQFATKVRLSIHSPARPRDELAVAVRAHAVHRVGARPAEGALVRADRSLAVRRECRSAALAYGPHLESHTPSLTSALDEQKIRLCRTASKSRRLGSQIGIAC